MTLMRFYKYSVIISHSGSQQDINDIIIITAADRQGRQAGAHDEIKT